MKQVFFTVILMFAFSAFLFGQSEKLVCPQIKLIGPDSVSQVNQPTFFRVELSDDAKLYKISYEWTLENGVIISGQETSQITVLPKIDVANMKAVIKIKGLPENCPNTAKEIAGIAMIAIGDPHGDYGRISLENEYSRLDSFIITLKNDMSGKGVVHIFTDENESFIKVKKHIQLMVKYFKFRRFPPKRLTFVIEKSVGRRTLLWIFLEGVKVPSCENCVVLNGADL